MSFNTNTFLLAGTAITIAGVGLYIWDTRKETLGSYFASGTKPSTTTTTSTTTNTNTGYSSLIPTFNQEEKESFTSGGKRRTNKKHHKKHYKKTHRRG